LKPARTLLRLALSLAGFLGTLLVLETAFRAAGVSVGTVQINRRAVRRSANPRLQFELKPDAAAHAEVDYHINSHGMRNPSVADEKPAGVRRIAVLGDSIAFGYWVAEADAFPRQLEALMNRGGLGPVEVLNFGVPGYNLEQETERLRVDVPRFAPDFVIVGFCLNDLKSLSHEHGLVMDRSERRRHIAGRLWDSLLERSILVSWVEYRLVQLEARREFVAAKNPVRGGMFPGSPDDQRRELSSRFGAISELLRSARVPGLVAVFPMFGNRLAHYPHVELHRTVVEAAREAGLLAVDLLDCFKAYDFRDVRVDALHPSPMGHRIAAHAILDAMCAQGALCEGQAPRVGRSCTSYRPDEFPQVRGY